MQDLEQLLMARIKLRQNELQEEIFRHPPHDYTGFSVKLGEWQENQRQQESLRALMQQIDDQEI